MRTYAGSHYSRVSASASSACSLSFEPIPILYLLCYLYPYIRRLRIIDIFLFKIMYY